MKKSLILKLVLTAVLVFTLTGCGSDQEVDSSSSDANIQEELSAETPDDGMSADKEDVSRNAGSGQRGHFVCSVFRRCG